MNIPFIDLKKQQDRIRSKIDNRIANVLNHGQYIMGPEVFELEEKLADFSGSKHCISCSSGTDALLMILMAWDIGPGDAVFTSSFTFIATAEVIKLLGATPVFVDVDSGTFNIDSVDLKQKIQSVLDNGALTPKCIIPVDIFGLPADYPQIEKVAKEYSLFILEDAAQSFGGQIEGKRTGTFGHATATSFFPAKPLGGYGDGGAIFTDDTELKDKLNSIRVHGASSHRFIHDKVGINGRLDTIQAAILIEKLAIFDEELQMRNHVADQYRNNLESHFIFQTIPDGFQSAWAQLSILAESGKERSDYQSQLKNNDIPSVIYYSIPLHLQEIFKTNNAVQLPVCEDLATRIFSLPMHPYLDTESIDNITQTLLTVNV